MFGDKKLDVYEDQSRLEITVNWFSSMAYFLLFFCFVWFGFLFFWYAMAIDGGAPLVFKLFPLIHVGVGFYLAYYTACLFFNHSFVDIKDNYLTVTHKPIPWWRGNKEIPVSDIEQLYVKEKKSQSKNGTQYRYELRAKMRDSSDQSVVAIDGLESHQLLQIEEYLEQYIGIPDQPVKGEYGKSVISNTLTKAQPRRHRRDFSDSPLSTVYHCEHGAYLEVSNQSHRVIDVTQYDWKDGNSDKQFQLLDELEAEQLMYISQNQALLDAFAEQSLSLADSQSLLFNPQQAPTSLVLNGNTYLLKQHQIGVAFRSNISDAMELEQWWYVAANGQETMRVLNQGGMMRYFHGKQIKPEEFAIGLDLDQAPEREEELRERDERDWDEGDLV